MDAEIRPSLPQGSPFLAYGTAPSPFLDRRFPLLIAGIVLGVLLVVSLFLLFFWRIPYPSDASILATVGNGSRQGYVLDEDHISEFDLTIFGHMEHPERSRTGLVKLSAGEDLKLTTLRAFDLLPFFLARFSGKGYAIARLSDGTLIKGPIEEQTWKTDLEIKTSKLELPSMDLAIDLVAFPDAWNDLLPSLESYGLVTQKIAPPSILGFSPVSGTTPNIQLGYEDSVPPSSKIALAAFAGLTDRRLTELPDGEMAEELFLPEGLLTDASSTAFVASGTGYLVTDTLVGVQTETHLPNPSCGDRTVFHLGGTPLEKLSQAWNLSLPEGVSLVAGTKEGKLIVCLPQK